MNAVALRYDVQVPDRPAVMHVPDQWRGTLNALRVVALSCRVAARTDVFRACALLSYRRSVATQAFAAALIGCLPEATGSRPVLLRPGENEVSFDEAWLIRAVMAAYQRDSDSFAFLIRSRVPRMYQRQIGFLIEGLSKECHPT